MPQILFSDPKPDGTVDWWYAETLWKHAEGLRTVRRRVDELPGMDEVLWYGGPMPAAPTCRAIAEHARQIYEADLSFPLILSAEGDVLDGLHRMCKAYIQGVEELDTVQFSVNPPPDGTLQAGQMWKG